MKRPAANVFNNALNGVTKRLIQMEKLLQRRVKREAGRTPQGVRPGGADTPVQMDGFGSEDGLDPEDETVSVRLWCFRRPCCSSQTPADAEELVSEEHAGGPEEAGRPLYCWGVQLSSWFWFHLPGPSDRPPPPQKLQVFSSELFILHLTRVKSVSNLMKSLHSEPQQEGDPSPSIYRGGGGGVG